MASHLTINRKAQKAIGQSQECLLPGLLVNLNKCTASGAQRFMTEQGA